MRNYFKHRETDEEKRDRLLHKLIDKHIEVLRKTNPNKSHKELFDAACREVWEKYIDGKTWLDFAELEADLQNDSN